jgi:hypothetical protein
VQWKERTNACQIHCEVARKRCIVYFFIFDLAVERNGGRNSNSRKGNHISSGTARTHGESSLRHLTIRLHALSLKTTRMGKMPLRTLPSRVWPLVPRESESEDSTMSAATRRKHSTITLSRFELLFYSFVVTDYDYGISVSFLISRCVSRHIFSYGRSLLVDMSRCRLTFQTAHEGFDGMGGRHRVTPTATPRSAIAAYFGVGK